MELVECSKPIHTLHFHIVYIFTVRQGKVSCIFTTWYECISHTNTNLTLQSPDVKI